MKLAHFPASPRHKVMAIISLSSNNKNQYRRYPFKQGTAVVGTNGQTLSDGVIVNCSLTTVYGKHRIYVKQICCKNSAVTITIASALESDEVLGFFSGLITSDFTTLQLTAYVRYVSGSITLGPLEELTNVSGVINFNKPSASNSTELEESVIFCYTPPAVTSIRDKKNNELRGFVNFGVLTNLTKVTNTETKSSNFNATYPASVYNVADESSYLGTCSNPIIKNINGVEPFEFVAGTTTVNDGNIYIAGVRPIVFFGYQGDMLNDTGVVAIHTEGVTLTSLCALKHNMLPPSDVTGFTLDSHKNEYYSKPALTATGRPDNYPYEVPDRHASNFNATLLPEYYYWPQFVKLEYYASWNLTQPSAPTITAITPSPESLSVEFTSPQNTAHTTITNYMYSLTSADLLYDGSWFPLEPSSTASPLVISGFTPNTTVLVKLRCVTASGDTGEASYGVLAATTQ